ncbi:MAG: hypothetical protein A3J83_08495 [Elusimicrobia bacterium RIFOXYA2_FULL_40_6]|nr:MAG: hypothetical protein A3J83_08495 [Elusimicrobia bacterium RIFOXYA2_FULL_40_6]
MFCPICRAEFEKEVFFCKECNIALVHELQSLPEDPEVKENLCEVFTATNVSESAFIQSLLGASEINSYVKDFYFSSMQLLGSGIPIKILVKEKDKETATDIVNQYYEDIKIKR